MGGFQTLHELLKSLYMEMLPLASTLIGPARVIGGMGAFLYICSRVWGHMARSEAIDIYPMFRPLVLGLIIAAYPTFLGMIDGMMNPVITATESMVDGQHKAIEELNKKKEKELASRSENQIFEDAEAFEKELEKYGITEIGSKVGLYLNKAAYDLKKSFRMWIKYILELFYQAAALTVNTVRTFYLVVLAMVGPISIGISIFPGFQSSLTNWVSRFVNVFLWLPVANIFGAICGKIQVLMLEADIAAIQAGQSGVDATDYGYMLFLIIAIAGYFTIPSVAGWIISTSGMGSALSKVTQMGVAGAAGAQAVTGAATGGATNMAGTAAGAVRHSLSNFGKNKS